MFLMFTGQGSQFVGMAGSFYGVPEMCNTLAEADDALSMNLSAIIRNGTDDQLRQTEYAQPALFAISIGIMRVVSARINIRPSFLAGHSAGEYSALHAAGSLSFADAIRTLKIRGQAMQNGCPDGYGKMAAIIGLEYSRVAAIVAQLNDKCYIANDNGGGQVVISGESSAVSGAIDVLKAEGARAIELRVSAPFHTPLTGGAEEVASALEAIGISRPAYPTISNVTAMPYSSADEIKSLLALQITSMVRWRSTVEYVVAQGGRMGVEFGPSNVLAKLATKISGNMEAICIAEEADLSKLEDMLAKAQQN